MLYDLRLSLTYDYTRPVMNGRHILRLLPQNNAGAQQLISGLVSIEPRPDDRRDGQDFFGNARTEIAYHRPIDHVVFSLAARVRRLMRPWVMDLSPPLDRLGAEVASIHSLAPHAPAHFLGDSPRVRRNAAISHYAAQAVADARSVQQAIAAFGAALHRDMAFDPEATDVDTDPEAAFTQRRGVCQDFTHIMIAGLRGLSIPAGYVSGFLRTIPPAGQERLEGADAMHAWVTAWAGSEMGWLHYDPTNDLMVASDHVTVAIGRDYADVAPIRGSIRHSGRQKAKQAVDVIPL